MLLKLSFWLNIRIVVVIRHVSKEDFFFGLAVDPNNKTKDLLILVVGYDGMLCALAIVPE